MPWQQDTLPKLMLAASQQNSLALTDFLANRVTQQLVPRLICLELVWVTLHHIYSFNVDLSYKEHFNSIYEENYMACASKMSNYTIRRVFPWERFQVLQRQKEYFKISLYCKFWRGFGRCHHWTFYVTLLYIFYSKFCKVDVICYNPYLERFDFFFAENDWQRSREKNTGICNPLSGLIYTWNDIQKS